MRRTSCAFTLAILFVLVPTIAFGQEVAWKAQFGTLADDVITSVAGHNLSGRLFVGGWTEQPLSSCCPHQGGVDGFVRAFNAAGVEGWTRQFGTTANDYVKAIATDATGNVYVAGQTSGNLGGQNSGSSDVFVRRFDANGNLQWGKLFGTSELEQARGITVDELGDVYVVGDTSGDLDGLGDAVAWDGFLRRYDSSGNEVWTQQIRGSGADSASSVATDPSGAIYVVGDTQGLDGPAPGGFDAYIRRYDRNGNLLWSQQFGTTSTDAADSVDVDQSGNIYVAGGTHGSLGDPTAGDKDVFLRRYDATGSVIWTEQFGSSGFDAANSVTTDTLDNVYVAGSTTGSLGATNAGGSDAYARRYSSSGSLVWSTQVGSSQSESANGITTLNDGRSAYVAGSTRGTIAGSHTSGDLDAFVVALQQGSCWNTSNPIGHEGNSMISQTVHNVGEPTAGAVGLGEEIHEVNCTVIVPLGL